MRLPIVLSALLLAGCGVSAQGGQPSTTVRPSPVAASSASSGAAPSANSAGEAGAGAASRGGTVPSAGAAAATSTPAAGSGPSASASSQPGPAAGTSAPTVGIPVELRIPAIHVDAPVEQVGEDATGAMEAPAQWNDVAWFKLGYRPGQTGSAVIAGHLDSTTDKAVFWDLHLLKPGNQVLLKDDDGTTLTFQVVSSTAYAYDQAPLAQIFGPASGPVLNLITCNGSWDAANQNYNQRLVVSTKEVAA